MMNKRVKAWLLCVLMLCSVVSLLACNSGNDSGSSPTTPPSQPSTSPTEPSTEPVPEGYANYAVTLIDSQGNPCGDKMLVTFMQDGQKVSMVKVSAEGMALKQLPIGDYTVVVSSTNADLNFYYTEESAVLSADKNETTIVLYNEQGDAFQSVFAYSPLYDEVLPLDAYAVEPGSTHVYLSAGDRTYFLFAPAQAGIYELSVNNDVASVGVYGASVNYIQQNNYYEVVDNKISVSVTTDMIGTGNTGTTVFVIGLDASENVEDAVLNIIRTGDPAWSITQEPWVSYTPKMPINPFTADSDISYKEFDLSASTDTYKLVVDAEGYYHLNTVNGPRVYVQLEEMMYGISMMDMVGEIVYQDGELIPTGTAPFRYMYNNGPDDFFKEDYTDAMRKYVTNRCPATGLYPLTEDLAYILPMGMALTGWLNESNSNFLFRDLDDFNAELGWLFLCVYEDVEEAGPKPTEPTDPKPSEQPSKPSVPTEPSEPSVPTEPSKPSVPTEPSKPSVPTEPSEPSVPTEPSEPSVPTEPSEDVTEPSVTPTEPPIKDNQMNPIMVGGTLEFEAEVKANHIVYFDLLKYNDAILTIYDEDAYITYKNKKYEAVDGVVTVSGLYVRYTNQPISISIGNKGTEDKVFKVVITYPEGHAMNPIDLKLDTFVTDVAANNEVGVSYQWIAADNGTLTISIDDITDGVSAALTITRVEIVNGLEIPHTVSLDETAGTSLSIDVEKGQLVKIIIGTQPVRNKYPAATITLTATFN